MKIDYEILFEFLPQADKNSFVVWESAYVKGYHGFNPKVGWKNYLGEPYIVASYRAPLTEKIAIPVSAYDLKLKQKERNTKINLLLDLDLSK